MTDVGGVKTSVMAAAAALPAGVRFVGGHPMAGAERGGFEAARADLFAGAPWALVGGGPARAAVAALVRQLGARPVACGAEEHDRAVAFTSHLPQLLATALAAELEARGDALAAELVGPAGRDLLRLAASPWAVWSDVLEHNREEVERALDAVRGRAGQPADALAEEFAAAGRFARRLGGVSSKPVAGGPAARPDGGRAPASPAVRTRRT